MRSISVALAGFEANCFMLKTTLKAFGICFLVVLMFEAVLFFYEPAGRGYQYWRGKGYPDNRVYQALLAGNADIHTGAVKLKIGGRCVQADVSDEFRRVTAGEPFHLIEADFRELGMPPSRDAYVSGKEYGFGLFYRDISRLKVPDSLFYRPFASEASPNFDVRIKYHSDTDYEVLKSTVSACQDML